MTLHDARGLAVSSRNSSSVEGYERALDLSVSYFVDPLATINAVLAEDPAFAAGHCLRAALGVMSSERGAHPLIAESVAAIESPDARANARELAHAAAARLWLQGDLAGALRRYGDIAVEHPRDLLALQTAHVGDFMLGQATLLRDRIAAALPHWNADVPGYGYVLGMHAFGLEETGLYARAEETGRRALEVNRRDPWAVHAVAHVMEMQGRVHEGIGWLEGLVPHWSVDNAFAFHNWWHLALYHLEIGDHARALELYDQKIRPVQTPVALEMIDASAMLWRLSLRGVDVGARWSALADAWRPIATEAHYAFNDAHAVMALVGAGAWHDVDAAIASLERAASGQDTNAMMSREVGLPFARGLAAFGRGRYDECIEQLQSFRGHAHRFGGSNAQRDIVHLTLVEAALRGRRKALAQALAAERLDLKPSSPFNRQLVNRARELSELRSAA